MGTSARKFACRRHPTVLSAVATTILLVSAVVSVSAVTLQPGDLVVTDDLGPAILRVDPGTGSQTTITSGGLLGRPVAVAIEETGNILVVDGFRFGPNGSQIIRVDPATGGQSVVSAGGTMLDPHDIAIDSDGSLLIADFSGPNGLGGILRVDAVTGAQTVVFSSPDVGHTPFNLALEASGDILFTRLNFFETPLFRFVRGTGTTSLVAADVSFAHGLALESNGEILAASQPNAFGSLPRVLRVDPGTGSVSDVSSAGLLQYPAGIAVDSQGFIYVTDGAGPGPGKIVRVDPISGSQTLVSSGVGIVEPHGLAVVPPAAGCGDDADCDDDDACTEDSCDSATGCVHTSNDADGDGVCGDADHCPDSILTPTVVGGNCDSGVANTVLATGCTIADLLATCSVDPQIPGSRFDGCVLRTLDRLEMQGVLNAEQQRAILRCFKRGPIVGSETSRFEPAGGPPTRRRVGR